MAWTYSDYNQQSTTTAKLARLELHITEVSDKVGARVSADGKSIDPQVDLDYLRLLKEERGRLLGMPDAPGALNGGVSLARLRRPC